MIAVYRHAVVMLDLRFGRPMRADLGPVAGVHQREWRADDAIAAVKIAVASHAAMDRLCGQDCPVG